jgi:hypothetical protein
MSNYLALTFDIKPGSEHVVERLFAEYGHPDHTVVDEYGTPVGRLLATTVFLKDQTLVRVVEYEGEFLDVARHMSRQPAIISLEAALEEHLAQPRDMSSPEGAARFFANSSMKCLTSRTSEIAASR